MKHILIKILFITALLYPVLSHSSETDNRGLLLANKDVQLVQGKYYLLSIGIDTYINLPKLKTAAGDAKEVTRVLNEEYGFDKSRITELYDANATEKNIISALRNIAKGIKPEDSLLIYYAGHGTLDDITKNGAWMPVEASSDDTTTWIENSTIKKYLSSDAIKARHILLISDSCFAGDFFRDGSEKPKEITDAFVRSAFLKISREALTSGGLEPVQDAGFSNHSVFSHFFLKALKENKEDYLLPQSIHERIKGGVSQNASQQVQYGKLNYTGGEIGGSFVFFKREGGGAERLDKIIENKKIEMTLLQEREKEMEKVKEARDKELKEREEKIALLDKKITEMKTKLGTTTGTGDSSNLDKIFAMVEEKKKENRELEEMKARAESERIAREEEIKRLQEEEMKNREDALIKDLVKYKEVANSEFGKEFAVQAWESLLDKWGVEKGEIKNEDIKSLKKRLNIFRTTGYTDNLDGTITDNRAGTVIIISPEETAEVYKAAYSAYLKGNFEFAISEFSKFLFYFPKSELTLSARYWIGESYYAKGDFAKSIETFTELNQKHPKSIKAPSANLKIAFSYFNLNKNDEAIKILNELIKEHPSTVEAEVGKDKLKLIEKKL